MANASSSRPRSADSGGGPICPGCGKDVDPLRAGHVAILEGRFVYFCDAECKSSRFRGPASTLSPDEIETAAPPAVTITMPANGAHFPLPGAATNGHAVANGARANGAASLRDHDAPRADDRPRDRQPSREPEREPVREPAREPSHERDRSDAPQTLRSPEDPRSHGPTRAAPPSPARETTIRVAYVIGIAAGALVPAVGLIGSVAAAVRLPLVLVAVLALVVRALLATRDPADPSPLVTVVPSLAAGAAALWAIATHDAHLVGILVLAGVGAASVLAVDLLVDRAKARLDAARERIARALDVRVRVLYGDEPVSIGPWDVKPGEQIVVEAGDVVGVDGIVTAGSATVTPWLDAPIEMKKAEGDAVVAGARVIAGRLRMTTTWSGLDRAWAKLTLSPALRIDVAAPAARAARMALERGAPVAAALVGVAAFASNASSVEVLAAASAAALAFGAKGMAAALGLHYARAQMGALASGIVYKDARAFERAGQTDAAVLCARGTVLMGEPEIVTIDAIGANDVARVLSLAAGAETASTHPFASAILRAARTRNVRPDNVRNAVMHSGLGVTALAASGERLIVGGRALMMQEKVSVALADTRVTELEAQGRSVLLVAVAEKLTGLLALQDGMRAGARAAVQRLLDARVEPVLLSGEARETCQSIGRALDIEHIRPEVLPSDRGTDVRSLAEAGHVVAVVGHASSDDGALSAADVSVAMSAAGSSPGEWSIALASDDVRDAAHAITIPHATRERVRAALIIGIVPGVVALVAVAFGIAPLAAAPLSALVSAIAALTHARET